MRSKAQQITTALDKVSFEMQEKKLDPTLIKTMFDDVERMVRDYL